MSFNHFPGSGQVIGRFKCQRVNPGHCTFGQIGECPRRGNFNHRGDAKVQHCFHAQVPANWLGHLGNKSTDHGATVMDNLAVSIGDQSNSGIVGAHGIADSAQGGLCACHVFGVKCAGNFKGPHAGTSRGNKVFDLGESAGHHNLPGAINVCRRESDRCGCGNYFFLVAAENRCHTGCRRHSCRSHCVTAFANKNHGLLGGEDPGANSRGDLADRVAGARTD